MRAALALVAALALTGCGASHAPTARDHVRAYLDRENAIVARSQPALVAVHQALVDFSQNRTSAATAKKLADAAVTFRRLRVRLRAANPPPQAAKLQRLVVEVVERQAALTNELRTLVRFEPAFAAALTPVAEANGAARARLRAAKAPGEVADAVDTYRAAIAHSLQTLRPLRPPALERPLYEAQVSRLTALDAALAKLAAAARAGDARAAARAEHEVSVAGVSSDSRANQIAERNAVIAYDKAVSAVAVLSQKITAERDRLQVELH